MAARAGRRRGGVRRIVGWIVKAILIFLVGSFLWVLLYRFVNPPITSPIMVKVTGGFTKR